MSRSNPKPDAAKKERLAAVPRVRMLELNNLRVQREILAGQFHRALSTSGEAAGDFWHAERPRLVGAGLLAADVIVTPSAWTPRPVPFPHPEPLPPTPTVLEAARLAAERLAEMPRMTREDHVALGVYLARLGLLHRELGWEE